MKTIVTLLAFGISGIYLSFGVGYNAEAVEPEATIQVADGFQVADGLLMADYWVNRRR
jgi:hypothetical protein